MCNRYNSCKDCPLVCEDCFKCIPLYALSDNADKIVDKWVSEHPVKTYAMDFFEKFPNNPKNRNGIPTTRSVIICRRELYKDEIPCMGWGNCSKCWNQEMKE